MNLLIPENVYENLSSEIKELTELFSEREKDVVLLSLLSSISGCLPNVTGVYDKKKYHAQLYLFIVAPAASGKGKMNLSQEIIEPIHNELIKNWQNEKPGNKKGGESTKKRIKLVPGNVSSARLYKHLADSQHGLVIFESEADSLSNMFKQDWGNFSDLLRKAFHHEKISISRETDDKYIEVTDPKLAMVLSGTFDQVKPLISSVSNGLFSRFLYYCFWEPSVWKDVSPNSELIEYSRPFKEFAEKVKSLYGELAQKNVEIRLSANQWDSLNNTMSKANNLFVQNGLSQFTSSAKRHGLIMFRLSMVLSILRNIDNIQNPVIICNDEDFHIAKTITKILLDHAFELFQEAIKKPVKLTITELSLLDVLPKQFKRIDAVNIALEKFQIPTRTMDDKLRVWSSHGILKKIKTGVYSNLKKTK